ncbi:hypothetical protein ASB58_13275 [Pseudomonas abyssi]|uniref:Transmembrane protein n=2 Tax=Pseudomonas TaxID=286 RepID=A0A395R1E4_9PSED|nr:hypothetical protein ASB58_13275 [Halopseudomonas gallaeciensis]|tara:strand:- start:1020 stop:1622 length:603 start_codon:yes stop_codon:yes gene_type:complete
MMSLTESEQRPSRPRGQLKLLAIIGVVVGPIALAALMAELDIGMPKGHANKSALVEPAIQTSDWQLAVEPVGYGAPWRLLVTHTGACERQCMALVHEARQINVAVGREAERVTHVLASPVALRADEVAALEAQFPRLERTTFDSNAYLHSLQTQPDSWLIGPQLWLVDPLGRVVLHHSASQPGKNLLDDLKRLLKLSKVG